MHRASNTAATTRTDRVAGGFTRDMLDTDDWDGFEITQPRRRVVVIDLDDDF